MLDLAASIRYRLTMKTPQQLLKNGDVDSEYLLRIACGISTSELLLNFKKPLTATQLRRFESFKKKRATGIPIQYIVREAWFFGLNFTVNKKVLIPRPESELMVERALEIAAEHSACSIMDLGTGSGAIAIALAKNCTAPVRALDISLPALTVARANAKKHKACVSFSRADILKKFPLPKTLHVILTANLPYLSDARMKTLSEEVLREPKLALYGGPDGLDLYRTLLRNLSNNKAQTIHALLEIDPEQKTKLATFVRREFPKSKLKFYPDLRGDIRLAEITF